MGQFGIAAGVSILSNESIQKVSLTAVCAALLANSRFFNEQLSRDIGSLKASFVSHLVGMLFLIGLAAASGRLTGAMDSVVKRANVDPRRLILLSFLSATCSVGVVYFANATAVEVHTAAAIPLFLVFIVLFSLIMEMTRHELSGKRAAMAAASLIVSIFFLFAQREMLTIKGVLPGAAAALFLTASRTSLRDLSFVTTPLASCLLVHCVLGVVGASILATHPELLVRTHGSAYLGGVMGSAFQFLLVVSLRRHGDLVANTLIQTQQVVFGYFTSFYFARL